MAVDEALLEAAAGGDEWTLRCYGWSEATLSLGYFQSVAGRATHAASRHCPLVRRQSGGGAIVHDAELTYSLIVPGGHPLARESQRLYRAVHGAFVRTLAGIGVMARMHEPAPAASPTPRADEPFLCFERRAEGDLLVGPAKVGGSAQRRKAGAVLQHGSLLLRRSAAAPELPGIEEAGAPARPWEAWRELFSRALLESLGLTARSEPLSESVRQAAATLSREKYGSPCWNERR